MFQVRWVKECSRDKYCCSLVISQRICRQMLTTGPGPEFRITFTSLEKTELPTSLILTQVSRVCIDMCDLNILSVHQLVDSNSGPVEPTFWALAVLWCHLVLELSLAMICPPKTPGHAGKLCPLVCKLLTYCLLLCSVYIDTELRCSLRIISVIAWLGFV